VLVLAVVDDRLVLLVAANSDRLRDDDATQGDDGHLARPTADVQDHAPRGLGDGQPGADRGGHGFLDEIGLAGAGREAGLLHCTLLDPGNAGGDAHHHARMGESVLVDPLYEVPQHLFRDVEIGDHTILQGPDGTDRPGGAPQHPLRVYAHGVDLAAASVDCDDRGFREHDPTPSYVDERVRGPEVHRHVAAAKAGQVAKEAHCRVISESLMGADGSCLARAGRSSHPSGAVLLRPRRIESSSNSGRAARRV